MGLGGTYQRLDPLMGGGDRKGGNIIVLMHLKITCHQKGRTCRLGGGGGNLQSTVEGTYYNHRPVLANQVFVY